MAQLLSSFPHFTECHVFQGCLEVDTRKSWPVRVGAALQVCDLRQPGLCGVWY